MLVWIFRHSWFEINGERVEVLDETDEKKILAAGGDVFFYTIPEFFDLLTWVETGNELENLEERKRELSLTSRVYSQEGDSHEENTRIFQMSICCGENLFTCRLAPSLILTHNKFLGFCFWTHCVYLAENALWNRHPFPEMFPVERQMYACLFVGFLNREGDTHDTTT